MHLSNCNSPFNLEVASVLINTCFPIPVAIGFAALGKLLIVFTCKNKMSTKTTPDFMLKQLLGDGCISLGKAKNKNKRKRIMVMKIIKIGNIANNFKFKYLQSLLFDPSYY